MNTELNDRILWHDGTNQVAPEMVPQLFLHGVPQDKIVVTSLNDDIKRFNQLSDEPLEMVKDSNSPLDLSWNIPEYYKQLDLLVFLEAMCHLRGVGANPLYQNRVKLELAEVEERKIEPLIRTLIYVVEKLTQEKKVWGVGRGSSCASLVLHLIGIHEVDPIKYNIPLTEFFHD